MQRLPRFVLPSYAKSRLASRFSAAQTTINWLPSPLLSKGLGSSTLVLLLALVFLAFISSSRIVTSGFSNIVKINQTTSMSQNYQTKVPKRIIFPLNCTTNNQSQTCPTNYYPTTSNLNINPNLVTEPTCPNYFKWIHEDLHPWKSSGITRDMVERAKQTAHFRLVIIKGKAYVEKYRKSIQSRDMFTIWGILQLLRRYPGRVPDLELMFDCDDIPVVRAREYNGPNKTSPPPLFRYCGDRWTLDIVFPDWSFWGWAEINIRPWENLLKELKEGNNRSRWLDRQPYAYWKGNPFVAETRRNLLKCNVSETQDWNARLFVQDWILESKQGYKHSGLASQCTHRFKIYIEGYAWSVSEKYILACDSVTLLVKPRFYDFFTRSLEPLHHYWPIREDGKCKSIKFAVDWGNNHKQEAKAMGKAASDFIQDEVKMDYVYDYMFHLLNEYAKLMKFEPTVPEGALELCSEMMACPAMGLERNFMMESLTQYPSLCSPCSLPPPFEPQALKAQWRKNINTVRRVERWENEYWQSLKYRH